MIEAEEGPGETAQLSNISAGPPRVYVAGSGIRLALGSWPQWVQYPCLLNRRRISGRYILCDRPDDRVARRQIMLRYFPGFVLALLWTAAASAQLTDRQRATAMAGDIDRFVGQAHQQHNISPNDAISDEQFVRRVYLDIAGRIPTYDELTEFLASEESDKRLDLVDQLMDSEGYVSHSYNYWADLLRIKTRLVNQVGGAPYIDWVKQALRDNMPYDQFVYELLTAQGRVTDHGAAGYFIRDSGMPLDNMANTVQVFLGTRIGCAQCHDHPFDKWTQYEFYEMAAFTFPVNTRQNPEQQVGITRAQIVGLPNRERQMLQNLIRPHSFAVRDTRKEIRLPADYKYKDAKPGSEVKPRAILGPPAEVDKARTPREAFAVWLTSRDNPLFARVIANRIWKRAMGAGLVEPVDDFTDDTEASIPQLLDYLTEQVNDLRFDIKAVSRAIYYSRTYQSAASAEEPVTGQPYYFPGPVLRRMTAEQLWDSVLTLVVPDLDGRTSFNETARRLSAEFDLEAMSGQEILDKVKEVVARREEGGDGEMRRKIARQAMESQPAKYRGLPPDFVRASESVWPPQPGSFLEQFGASDRELLNGATSEPTVTQALEMLNGRISNGVLNDQAMLARSIRYGKTPQQQARIVFVSILGREPQPHERDLMTRELRADPKAGLRNIATALLCTREFMFIQ
jgi:hypothetical protein